MRFEKNVGLVLEGGGMRCVFTSGVLDYFMDHDIEFSYAVSVSAGACNGLSYMSHQRGRAKLSNIDMLEKYKYIGLKYVWSQRSIFDRNFMYDTMTHEILPFDFDACFSNPCLFEMVTTNARTGKPCYLSEDHDPVRLIDIVKASSCLPFVSQIVHVDGIPMLDGGIVDSIPVERAIKTGHDFNIVVLTRNRGYRASDKDFRIPKIIYSEYPRLRMVLSHMNEYYNRQLEMIERMEDEGKVLVIRPQLPIVVDRLESDVVKLTSLYHEGYAEAGRVMSEFMKTRKNKEHKD